MNVLEPRKIKQQAREILERTQPEYRKTVALHSAVSLGALVIVMVLDLLLGSAMAQTGGLSGIGARSILGTAQGVLSTAVNILLPFWELGILYTSLRVARRQDWEFSMLTRGFRRVGPVVRYWLAQIVIYSVVAMVLSNIVAILSMFLPVPAELQSAMAQIDMQTVTDPEQLMAQFPVEQMLSYAMPILILFTVVYCGVLIHLGYRFRLSQYLLLDEQKLGALAALGISNRLTAKNKWNLAKLDLSFWWYYALLIVAACIAYGPELLALAGVTLPMSAGVAALLFYVLYAAASLAITWWAGAYVQTAYACAYEQLRTPPEDHPMIEE